MLKIYRQFLALVLGFSFVLPALAARVGNGTDSEFSLQRFGMTLDQIKQSAAKGDADAEYALGYMYYYGQGVTRDEDSARLWIGKAASQGQPQAAQAQQMLTQADPASGPGAGQTAKLSDNPKINPLATTAKAVANPNVRTNGNTVPPAAIPGDPSNVTPVHVEVEPGMKHATPNGTTTPTPTPAVAAAPAVDLSNAQNPPASITDDTTAINNVPSQKNAKVTQIKNKLDTKDISLNHKKLQSAPSDYYTVQLLGSHNKEEVTEFIHQHHLQNKAIYYKTDFRGKPWYVLVYGIYPSDHEAEVAILHLPKPIQKMNPWVKSIGSVKESMKLAKGN